MDPAMWDRVAPRVARFSTLLLVLTLVPAAPVLAQDADFVFGRPTATLSFMTGLARPGEGGDLFDFVRDELTLGRGDFTSALIGGEVGVAVLDPVDVTVGLEYSGRTVPSEMRDWVTQDDQPITQSTKFTRFRVSVGAKAYLLPRGRSISRYAWIPAPWSPFLGAGLGMTWYEFTQEGDFVDSETANIFEDRFTSRGHGITPWVSAGADITLSPYFYLRAEARHLWGTGSIDRSTFQGFEPLDLSGFRAMIGVGVRTMGRIR